MFGINFRNNVKGKKITLIVNPKAGRLVSEQRASHIKNLLTKKGAVVTVYYTERKNHATELVNETHTQSDIIVCCGGDGTLSETMEGVIRYCPSKPVGYIPSGTTNDFARTLGISKITESAVKAITNGRLTEYDIGHILESDKHFTYIASFGAFTSVSYQTPQKAKNTFGHVAYVVDGIKSIKDIRSYKATVTLDGKIHEGNFLFGSITNSTSVGGVMNFKKGLVKCDDGKFELLMIKKPDTLIAYSELIRQIINQKYDNENILFAHCQKVNIKFEDEADFTSDGEFAGKYSEITVENNQKLLHIYTPRKRND